MKKILLVALAGICSLSLSAKENVGTDGSNSTARVAAGCSPSQAKTDLNINNVRTTIMGGGDMWWNLSDGQYEIPKGGGKHSMFAGSLWIAGIDAGEQLKAAAMTYRQTGNDFWTGPLDQDGEIDAATCDAYDKHFQITRAEVDEFLAWFNDKDAYPNYTIPSSIENWPGNGVSGDHQFLAPYYDANDDGDYNPADGDYPKYDVDGTLDCLTEDVIYGDQTLWWVFNDKGNIHSETGADPIGLEIRSQAFAFATNDEINNMTFYNYKVINRATIQLKDAYFGQWVDPDLGKYDDDFVGCDVERGLGYCYNGFAEDEGATGYGYNPPAIGVDFFQGPLADPADGVDNDRDSIVDEPGEQAIMSRFVYYNNDFSVTGNPENGQHIYNYLRGIWKDGLEITYGGDGRGGSVLADFMFPGDTDPYGWGTDGAITQAEWENPLGWTEETVGNEPADRRFVQSAGPFTLEPGAVNRITTGVVWARADAGGPFASVELVRLADDKAQALFDNCFKVLNGPDAPDVDVVELDRELVLHLSNGATSNNFLEQYIEMDPLIISPPGEDWDPYYRFQGYQVYQLSASWVSVTDLDNPDLARLIFQSDIVDEVENLVNYEFDATIGGNVPTLEVSASNLGIEHSLQITDDQFATGDRELVNHKPYYFMSVAYAYNEYKEYNQNDPELLDGQKKPYKAGRKNIRVYTGIPHKGFTTILNAEIGQGVELKKILGKGNGGFALSLTETTEDEILASTDHLSTEPVYVAGEGPVDIQVIDPYHLKQSDFALKFYGDAYPGPTSNNR
nr:T9SS C-terminal target domain-containing protein [Paracoccaceae bacterium]